MLNCPGLCIVYAVVHCKLNPSPAPISSPNNGSKVTAWRVFFPSLLLLSNILIPFGTLLYFCFRWNLWLSPLPTIDSFIKHHKNHHLVFLFILERSTNLAGKDIFSCPVKMLGILIPEAKLFLGDIVSEMVTLAAALYATFIGGAFACGVPVAAVL